MIDALAVWLAAAPPVSDNPCTNGSFEELAPRGFPADWAPVGRTVEVFADAHTGRRALRFRRTRETGRAETGLNRGPLIRRLKEEWTSGIGRLRPVAKSCATWG